MMKKSKVLFAQYLSYVMSFLLLFSPTLSYANGNIVTDGTTGTSIDKAQNNVPVVNIAAPSAGGVSKNNFSNFNVGNKGVILNNSRDVGRSQLGGVLYGNTNLSNGAANIILNQVTSNNISRLEGNTEIFGQRAEYILANPNGIICNGCGFINTSRLTLATGKAEIDHLGRVQDIVIGNGIIDIGGTGLNADDTDYFNIISRAVKISSAIWGGKELNIKTGNDRFNYQTQEILSKIGQGLKPELAIDSSSLGGLYAGRISLIATESGIGVKTDGDLVSDARDIVITADGNIEYQGISSEGNINITSRNGGVTGKGKKYAKGNISLDAKQNMILKGEYIEATDVNINAQGDIENSGKIFARNNTSINKDQQTFGRFVNSGGAVLSNNSLTIQTTNLNNIGGKLLSSNDIIFDGVNFVNGEIKAKNDISFNAIKDSFTISSDTVLLSENGKVKIDLKGGNFTRNGDYNIVDVFTNNGSIEGGFAFYTDKDLSTSELGLLNKVNNLEVHANNLTSDTTIDTAKIIDFYSNGDFVNNASVKLSASEKILVDTKGKFTNQGEISVKDKNSGIGYYAIISEDNFLNEGLITSGIGSSNISVRNGDLTNNLKTLGQDENGDIKSRISSGGNLSITVDTGNLDNNTQISTGDGLTVTVRDDLNNNSGSLLFAYNDLIINADNILNDQAEIMSLEGSLILRKGVDIDNNSIKNTQIINQAGDIIAYGSNSDIEIYSKDLRNNKLYQSSIADQNGHNGRRYDGSPHGYAEYTAWYRSTTSTDYNVSNIQAGRDVYLYLDTGTNDASKITAVSDLAINGQSFKNDGYYRSVLKESSVYAHCHPSYSTCKFDMHGDMTWASWWGSANSSKHSSMRSTSVVLYSDYKDGKMHAGENLSIILSGTTQTSDNVNNNITMSNLINNGAITGGNKIAISADNISNTGSDSTTTTNSSLDMNFKPPSEDGNSIFKQNLSNKLKPLIETNVEYIDVGKFLGSKYFLSRIGFDIEKDTRLLGDSFYETNLIEEAILSQTGKHFLNGDITNSYDQMKSLYDNAITAKDDLQLTVGVRLTAEQINSLNQDIIWMVEKEVEGQKVLMPQIYLSKATLENIQPKKGGTIEGEDVTIMAENNIINNGGNIKAKNSLKLSAGGNIENQVKTDGSKVISEAVLEAKNIDIYSIGSFTDIGGNIKTDNDLNIAANNAIFTTASLHNKKFEKHNFGYTETDMISNKASKLNIGGNFNIKSKNNISFVGSEVNVGNDVDMNANDGKGEINILSSMDTIYSTDTTITVSETHDKSWSGKKTTKTTTHITKTDTKDEKHNSSVFNIGGNANLKAKDINIAAIDGKSSVFGNNVDHVDFDGTLNKTELENSFSRRSSVTNHTVTTTSGGFGGSALGNATGSFIDGTQKLSENPSAEFRTNPTLRMAGRVVATYYGGPAGAAAYEAALVANDEGIDITEGLSKDNQNALKKATEAGAKSYVRNAGGGIGAAALAVYDAEKSGERGLDGFVEAGAMAYMKENGGAGLVAIYEAKRDGKSNQDAFKDGLYKTVESEAGNVAEYYGVDRKVGKAVGGGLIAMAKAKDSGESDSKVLERGLIEGGKSYASSYVGEEVGKGGELITRVGLNIIDISAQGKDWEKIAYDDTVKASLEYAEHNYEENKQDRFFGEVNDQIREATKSIDGSINQAVKDGLEYIKEEYIPENAGEYLAYAGGAAAAYLALNSGVGGDLGIGSAGIMSGGGVGVVAVTASMNDVSSANDSNNNSDNADDSAITFFGVEFWNSKEEIEVKYWQERENNKNREEAKKFFKPDYVSDDPDNPIEIPIYQYSF